MAVGLKGLGVSLRVSSFLWWGLRGSVWGLERGVGGWGWGLAFRYPSLGTAVASFGFGCNGCNGSHFALPPLSPFASPRTEENAAKPRSLGFRAQGLGFRV